MDVVILVWSTRGKLSLAVKLPYGRRKSIQVTSSQKCFRDCMRFLSSCGLQSSSLAFEYRFKIQWTNYFKRCTNGRAECTIGAYQGIVLHYNMLASLSSVRKKTLLGRKCPRTTKSGPIVGNLSPSTAPISHCGHEFDSLNSIFLY